MITHSFHNKVFVKMDLIQCGLIPAHGIVTKNIALGKNMVVTRASNKGGVRVRLPLDLSVINHNFSLQTSLDFVCCHLAADTNGESKVEKRNQNAQFILISFIILVNSSMHLYMILQNHGDLSL